MKPLFAVLGAVLLLAAQGPRADATGDCHIGAYRLADGRALDIAPSERDTLRWRLFTGETGQPHKRPGGAWDSTYGWTGRPDGKTAIFSDCAAGTVTFDSGGISLVGRLVMPKGAGRVPVVVLVHGSEYNSARDFNALQRMFPAHGIGAFVYDKRGTGASGGAYTQDFEALLLTGGSIGGARAVLYKMAYDVVK